MVTTICATILLALLINYKMSAAVKAIAFKESENEIGATMSLLITIVCSILWGYIIHKALFG